MNSKMRFVVAAVIAVASGSHALHARPVGPTSAAAVHTVSPRNFEAPAAEGVATKVQRTDAGEVFTVASTGAHDPIVINLGWMPAKPGADYRTHYRLRAADLEAPVSVHIMVREHEAMQVRPFTPYHVRNARARQVTPDQAGEWITRELTFTARDDARALSAAIVISGLHGKLQLSAFELLDDARHAELARERARAEYGQLMEEIHAQAAARKPLLPRPLVFSRSQMKYGLERNYYHKWVDRPLFVNRAYRVPHEHVTPFPSYQRILQEVAKYDIDGLAFFPATKGRMGMFELHEQANVEGVGLLPEFLPAISDDHIDVKTEILKRAMSSPHTPRIDGKLLITSYHAEALTPAEWDAVLTELRKRVGDTFLFLPTLTNVVALRDDFNSGEPISRETMEEKKDYLRAYLDVCDGIYFNYPAAFRNKDRTFDAAFYREMFIPVFKSVLSEPAYRDKYLGLSAYKSHMSPDRGNSLHEDGTRTLRYSFEAAMDAQPDVIILPEWDEFNENTCFRPTVYGSTTTERIVRYYMSRIKDKAPTPVPGDDVSVPNLILSTRKAVTLGEPVMVELLNVPDSTDAEEYDVEVTLLDEHGEPVQTFGPVTFDATKLQEERFYLDSKTIPDVRTLVPTVKVIDYKGEDLAYDHGFHHVQVRATWNWDYLAVKQPLRDLLRPTKATFAWEGEPADDGSRVVTGTVASPEKLALVEVVGDDGVVYAVDPKGMYHRNDPDRELVFIEYRSLNTVDFDGTVTLENATADWFTSGDVLHQPGSQVDVQDSRVAIDSQASVHDRWIGLAVPKDAIEGAQLTFDFDNAQFSVPLAQVFEKKMIARGFGNGLHITVYPYRQQPDMPFHLNETDTSFRVRVWPEITTEQFHLRLTSVEGKTYRTRPLLLPNAGGATRTLRIYDETSQQPVDVPVAADRIPELVYDFDPERGAVLLTDAGRPFWASLGGFTSTTTGRGTVNGLFRGKFPEQVERSAPQWVEEDGQPCLRFDGKGTYLELPREALPRRGSFTLEFDIKPATAQDQFLLVNRVTGRQKGLSLQIRDGKLFALFRGADWKTYEFPTDLAVPADAWSTIRVRHDFQRMAFSVNGEEVSFPLTLPASNIGFTVIGEGWTGNWFDGYLRSLRIVHNAQ